MIRDEYLKNYSCIVDALYALYEQLYDSMNAIDKDEINHAMVYLLERNGMDAESAIIRDTQDPLCVEHTKEFKRKYEQLKNSLTTKIMENGNE